jgi:hypothetical protein
MPLISNCESISGISMRICVAIPQPEREHRATNPEPIPDNALKCHRATVDWVHARIAHDQLNHPNDHEQTSQKAEFRIL